MAAIARPKLRENGGRPMKETEFRRPVGRFWQGACAG